MRGRKASGCACHRNRLFLQRLANALRDHGRIILNRKNTFCYHQVKRAFICIERIAPALRISPKVEELIDAVGPP